MTGMMTSTFSHKSLIHLGVNMVAFNVFAIPLLYKMSGNEFVPMYFTGGAMLCYAGQV